MTDSVGKEGFFYKNGGLRVVRFFIVSMGGILGTTYLVKILLDFISWHINYKVLHFPYQMWLRNTYILLLLLL